MMKTNSSTNGLAFIDRCLIAVNVLLRVYCGLFMIISDCDETYNYWEPLNLISRGFGKQTWEYSPDHSIRSYLYLIPYYLASSPLRDLSRLTGYSIVSYAHFYYIRIICLCGFTSFTEIHLFLSVRKNLSLETSRWYLLVSSVSAGMGHASSALLPSSFAMNWITLGSSFGLSFFNTNAKTSNACMYSVLAISSVLVGGIIGWPFTLVLGVCFGVYTLWDKRSHIPYVITGTLLSFLLLSSAVMIVDSFYYKKPFVFVPLNIVLYNVFASEHEGPSIFGTEPWTYYPKNLLINYNVSFLAAYAGIFFSLLRKQYLAQKMVCVYIPLLVWTAVFESQEHKEERFLYPIYPYISLAAATFYEDCFHLTRHWVRVTRIFKAILCLSVISLSVLRILNLVDNYSAPLSVAKYISATTEQFGEKDLVNVCIGREWYHFPTSFFLPDNYRLRFISSSFDGLLPGDFLENQPLDQVTSTIPAGMNSRNEFSSMMLYDINLCDLIIDNTSESNIDLGDPDLWDKEGNLNPNFEILHCEQMINAAGSSRGIGRLLFVPKQFREVMKTKIDTMGFCLIRSNRIER